MWGNCSHVLPSILNVNFSLCTLVYLYFCQLMKNVHVMCIVYYVNSQYFLASSACKKASAADMDNHISSVIISMCMHIPQWRVWVAKANLDSSGYNYEKSKQEKPTSSSKRCILLFKQTADGAVSDFFEILWRYRSGCELSNKETSLVLCFGIPRFILMGYDTLSYK